MKKTLAVLVTLMVLAGAVYGAPKSKVKIALIIESTVDDKGWGQAMHDAIVAVQKKYGESLVEYNYSEKMKPVDAGSAARQYASRGFDIIIAHGAQFKNLILELSEEFPKTTFAFGTNADVGPRNVFTYMPMSEETGYINGVIAGMVTKTGIIGVVGPVDAGDSARYNRGFWLGVKSVNPKADIKVAHTGSFADYVKAGELAQTQIKAGADVLTGAAQQATGALRAVAEYKDKPIWWLGQDTLQLSIPESFKVIAAASYDYAPVIEAMIDKRQVGTLGGENIPMTFKNGGFIFKYNDKVGTVLTAAIRKAADKARADITAQTLKIDWQPVKY
ncbi:MAG: BMP family ABC transporter substrate-binding protein [Spirochaetae bacterium HGW-Spirochaetae-7]|jgi:basic membrane protein A|nr:MAG: BMP family ABC transporter substrate-binding protein [Spirochaetae bacterium HGW-Spirochaetae-7]